MRNWVESEASGITRRMVSKIIGSPTVRHFVNDYRKDKNDKIYYLHTKSTNGNITP